MNLIAGAARMWLTKSFRPFTFTNQTRGVLEYNNTESLGLYVHLPFCRSLCAFCPYCKILYHKETARRYIEALISEIELVCESQPMKKNVSSLYFGGGSPALLADDLEKIIATLRKYFIIRDGIGVELHPDDVTKETLTTLKDAGITKISIGIQSFSGKFLKVLGREGNDIKGIFQYIHNIPFETISMDFIFALPGQTFETVKNDIDTAFENGANHVALYPFIDFTFTKSRIPKMRGVQKRKLMDKISDYCTQKGYIRDSVWTFAKPDTKPYSSMTRDNFLGFGCSATTLLKKQFKVNTFSIEDYIRCINTGKLPTALTLNFTQRQRMIYYLFWRFYTTKMNPADFENFFGVAINKVYGFELRLAELLGFIDKSSKVYIMTKKGAFYYHYFESYYTLSYIDKMWGLLQLEAFPGNMTL